MLYVNNEKPGYFNAGDMQQGDREATPEEVAAYELSKLPTENDLEEIKRKLLGEAIPKRDFLLMHLERFRIRAKEANDATAQAAISAAIASYETMFNDPRVVAAIDGEVTAAVKTINREIGTTLYLASPTTYAALLALDPL